MASSIVAATLLWKKGAVSAASTICGGLNVPSPNPSVRLPGDLPNPPSRGIPAGLGNVSVNASTPVLKLKLDFGANAALAPAFAWH